MPRRNNREQYIPVDLTPSPAAVAQLRREASVIIPGRGSTSPGMVAREKQNAERQRNARAAHGIDWTTCVVPGCGRNLAAWNIAVDVNAYERNHETNLPLCHEHAVVAWQQVQRHRHLPIIVETAEQMAARHHREAYGNQRPAPRSPDEPGELYFVRVNDLVKVGWTATLKRRLKEYGAGAELLCHYPGTPRDETSLHHRLTPVRAKGREWYHDGDVIQGHVEAVITQHGPPRVKAEWTQPKHPVTIRYAKPA